MGKTLEGTRGGTAASVGALALAILLATGCAPLSPGIVTQGTLADNWEIRADPEFGTPSKMTNRSLEDAPGQGSRALPDSAAEAAAQAVFAENARWFRIRPGVDGLRLVRSYAYGWLRQLRFEQTYRGLSVAGAGYDVRVLPNGRVGTVEGRFHPDIVLEISPVLQATHAEERARAAYLPGSRPVLPSVGFEDQNLLRDPRVLLIVPDQGRYRLAWAVRIRTDEGYSRVYVDASSGDLIGAQMLGPYER